jgi:hypothetical protein
MACSARIAGAGCVACSGAVFGSSADGAPAVGVGKSVGTGSRSAALAADGSAATSATGEGDVTSPGVRQIKMPEIVNPRHPQIPATTASRRVVNRGARSGGVATTARRSTSTAAACCSVENTTSC